MSEREKILGRIREALRVSSPRPDKHDTPTFSEARAAASEARQWLPAVEADLTAQFARNSEELRTSFLISEDAADAAKAIAQIAAKEKWERIACHRGTLTDAVVSQIPLPQLLVDGGYAPANLEVCDAGITECDALVAQTGSILITAKCAGGRALSVLPPHHIVLARRDQLVSDLPAAYALLHAKYAEAWPSFISFITGPSRTGDIERILVLGAHGPKKLTIVIW